MKIVSVGAGTIVGAVIGLTIGVPIAQGHNASNTPTNGIVHQDDYFAPGSGDESSNGIRIFLSSPRHSNSGNRGECSNPGYQENVNGRRWNWYAANHQSFYNIHSRGYTVRVSRNTKDNGFLQNRANSQNWGSDIHIITHTNALYGCNESSDYTLYNWEHDADARDDKDLANKIRLHLSPEIPGPMNFWEDNGWAELETNARWGDAYVELQFHSNQTRQAWLFANTDIKAWYYGKAIDDYLGYPT